MAAVTLEELAKRVEVLEQEVAQLRPDATPVKPKPRTRPGRGNWAAVVEGLQKVTDYDYDATPDQNAVDIEHEKREAEKWNRS